MAGFARGRIGRRTLSPGVAIGIAVGFSLAVFLYSGCSPIGYAGRTRGPKPTTAAFAGTPMQAALAHGSQAPQPLPFPVASAQWLPYFSQYDNKRDPGGTSGLTSSAMVLRAFGQTLSADDLYAKYGKAKGQEPSGVAAILRSYGLRAVATKSGDRASLKAHLSKGRVAVVHGDWTDNGHSVVFKGLGELGWIVNDPAGNWEDCYDCASRGDGVTYGYGEKFDQLLSHDGDVWYTLVDGQ